MDSLKKRQALIETVLKQVLTDLTIGDINRVYDLIDRLSTKDLENYTKGVKNETIKPK
jgi:hypothetical protein